MNDRAIPQAMIRQIVERIRCTACKHHFRANDIQIVGRRGNAWAMKVKCPMCGAQALLFAVLTERAAEAIYSDLTPEEWKRFEHELPISIEDVIAFHKFMSSYAGDFSDILEDPLPPEG
jgi:hypothetical protein